MSTRNLHTHVQGGKPSNFNHQLSTHSLDRPPNSIWRPSNEDTMKEPCPSVPPAGRAEPHDSSCYDGKPRNQPSYATLGGSTIRSSPSPSSSPGLEALATASWPGILAHDSTNTDAAYNDADVAKHGARRLPDLQPESDKIPLTALPQGTDKPNPRDWMRQDRQDRKCIIVEAIVAAVVVVVIVLAAVLGTQLSRHKHTEHTDSTTITPSGETVPLGTVYNASITVGGDNCSTQATCGALSGTSRYTSGVSQNLYGNGTSSSAWSCGTCWQLKAETDGSGLSISNASAIVVSVVNDCPATPGNDLCLMENLADTNVHGANVDFNLCPDSDAALALFGSASLQLGLGRAIRVEC